MFKSILKGERDMLETRVEDLYGNAQENGVFEAKSSQLPIPVKI